MNLWSCLSRSRRNQELDDEIRAHLALAARDRMEHGEPPDAACSAARREFGNPTLIKEVTREMWGWNSLETLAQDVRYALRMMRRTSGFTAVAILSLALGIGANTAIFSLIDTLMLRSLPVDHPEQLVELLTNTGNGHFNAFSWQSYQEFRDRNHVFSSLIACRTDPLHPFHVRGEGLEPERLDGRFVSGNFFAALGVKPALGRLIGPEDDRMGSPATVAVVSWAYWKNHFNLDPGILGKRLVLEDVPVTVVGVTPPEFFGLQVGSREDISVPLAMEALINHPSYTSSAGYKWLKLVGRLKPGVSIEQARAELAILFHRALEDEAQLNPQHRPPNWRIGVEPAGAGLSRLRDEFANPLLLLMGVVGLLLLIACANVAGMLLARGVARQREMALRASLGASRWRLTRQALTEALLLSVVSGACGIVLAYRGSDALVRIMASGRVSIQIDTTPDARVLLFTLGAALLTGVLFGLVPALRGLGLRPGASIQAAGRAGETRFRRALGRSLVVVQVALSVVLLSAAGLFIRQLARLEHMNLGFQRDHVLLVELDPFRSGYTNDKLLRAYHELLMRLETIPGVRSATVCWIPPISGGGSSRSASVESYVAKPRENRDVYLNWVAPRYFETLGVPILAGRDFSIADEHRSRVAIINQTMARTYFGDGNPIGRHVTFDGEQKPYEIVGVAGDARYLEMRDAVPRTIYLHAFQEARISSQFALRTAIDPATVAPEVRRSLRNLLKGVAVGRISTLEEYVDASIVPERLIALLSGLFGMLGSLLAAIGLYGLLAYTVARRTNEIGIRMALGARRGDVTRMILRDAFLMVGSGLAVGAPIALWGKSFVAGLMKDLPATDAVPIVIGIAAMVAVGLLAACVPARRASRVDPMEALRYE